MPEYIDSTVYMYKTIFFALLFTLTAGWLGIKTARHFNLLDIPGSETRKRHKNPTPKAGGIAIAISMLLMVICTGLWKDPSIRYILLSGTVIFLFGLWDDAKNIPPIVKLSGQLLAAVLLIISGIYIQIFETGTFFIGAPEPVYFWLDRALTILWVIGVTNAFNLVDSMDGLSVGLAAWAFGFFALATFDSQQPTLSILSAALLGICLGLSYYNTSPARLFLGDAGALMLGFFFSVIAILYSPAKAEQTSSWFVPILLVGIPIFDTSLVTFSRIRRGKKFYKGGFDHTYHRLVSFGLEPGRAVLAMHLAAVALECIAFIAVTLPPLFANIIFLFCLLAGLFLFLIIDHPKIWKSDE